MEYETVTRMGTMAELCLHRTRCTLTLLPTLCARGRRKAPLICHLHWYLIRISDFPRRKVTPEIRSACYRSAPAREVAGSARSSRPLRSLARVTPPLAVLCLLLVSGCGDDR